MNTVSADTKAITSSIFHYFIFSYAVNSKYEAFYTGGKIQVKYLIHVYLFFLALMKENSNLNCVMRKTSNVVFEQVRYEPSCTKTEDG